MLMTVESFKMNSISISTTLPPGQLRKNKPLVEACCQKLVIAPFGGRHTICAGSDTLIDVSEISNDGVCNNAELRKFTEQVAEVVEVDVGDQISILLIRNVLATNTAVVLTTVPITPNAPKTSLQVIDDATAVEALNLNL